jgi:GNAT superfamily N-acetyltransferase
MFYHHGGRSVDIRPFAREHAAAFDALNRAWLTEHGLLEPADEAQLVDPWTEILAPGGQIFVALAGTEVVGTCAVVPHHGTMELAKLTVAPKAKGQGLGRRLVLACLDYARQLGVRRVVLLSSSRLSAALRLYQDLGFQPRPVPPDSAYLTADVYMELDLESPAEPVQG